MAIPYRSSNPYHTTPPAVVVPSGGLAPHHPVTTQWLDAFGETLGGERQCRVLMSGLPFEEITDMQILTMFQETLRTEVMSAQTLYAEQQQFLGMAIVTLSSYEDARRACESFDNQLLDGKDKIRCRLLLSPSDSAPTHIANFLFPDYRYAVADAAIARVATTTASASSTPTASTSTIPPRNSTINKLPGARPAAYTGLAPPTGPRSIRVTQANVNGKQKAAEPAKGPIAIPSLISRIDIGLKDRIGGKLPAGLTGVVGQGVGGTGNVPTLRGRVATQKEQAALLKIQRANFKAKSGHKAAITGQSPKVAALAARISTKHKKPTAAQAKASNLAGKPKVKATPPTAQKTVAQPTKQAAPKEVPKTTEELDDEIKAYQRLRRFGGAADNDGDASMV